MLLAAGVGFASRLVKKQGTLHSTALFRTVVEINLIGTFICAKHAAAHMKDLPLLGPERGVIITVSSSLGYDAPNHFIAYSASKAAVMGMMLPMARDLGKYAIRVVSIAPGFIKTPMNENEDENLFELIAKQTPMGRLQTPSEFAHLARVVAENTFINAVTIKADGGAINPNL